MLDKLAHPGSDLPRRLLIAAIHLYRVTLSPFLGQHCRFHPTCSRYAEEAIARHGAARGSDLALRRLLKCHPWHAGGADPVPDSLPSTRGSR